MTLESIPDEWIRVQDEVALAIAENPVAKLSAEFLDTDQLSDLPDPEPLIADWLMLDSLAVINGKPGVKKSFLALDFAMSVATGTWWLGRYKVKQGSVLYVAAEGGRGYDKRIKAWKVSQRYYAKPDIRLLPRRMDIYKDVDEFETFLQLVQCEQPNLIVFDTLSRCMPGGNESGPEDMSLMVDRSDQLRRTCGACVLWVHHTDKSGNTGRGHSAFEGAMDTEIRVSSKGAEVTVKHEKQKDGPEIETKIWAAECEDSLVLCPTRPLDTTLEDRTTIAEVSNGLVQLTEHEAISTKLLCDELDIPRSTIHYAINRLVSEGKAVNVGTKKRALWRASQYENNGE